MTKPDLPDPKLPDHARDAMRAKAEAVLSSLERDRDIQRQQLAELHKDDAVESLTGRSALDRAIEATRRVIRQLDRQPGAVPARRSL